MPLPYFAEELSSNYADLTLSYEAACSESQRLGLKNQSLSQEAEEQQGELVDAELRMRLQADRVEELTQQLAAQAQQLEELAGAHCVLTRQLDERAQQLDAARAEGDRAGMEVGG